MLAFIGSGANASLPRLGIDPLTDSLEAGAVPFVFDLLKDFEASHADAAYTNGETITDLSETDDGSMAVASGHAVTSNATYGGANFSAIASGTGGTHVAGPVGSLAGIDGGNQYFLVVLYVVMPASGDWNTSTSLAPFFDAANTNYTAGADLVTIAQYTSGGEKRLEARRQTDGASTTVTTRIVPDAGAYGQVAQIAFWRNANGNALRLRTATTDQTTTGPVGSANSGDFSARYPKFGITNAFWAVGANAGHQGAVKFSLLRGFVENLEISGRNPNTVLNEDWARVSARLADL